MSGASSLALSPLRFGAFTSVALALLRLSIMTPQREECMLPLALHAWHFALLCVSAADFIVVHRHSHHRFNVHASSAEEVDERRIGSLGVDERPARKHSTARMMQHQRAAMRSQTLKQIVGREESNLLRQMLPVLHRQQSVTITTIVSQFCLHPAFNHCLLACATLSLTVILTRAACHLACARRNVTLDRS